LAALDAIVGEGTLGVAEFAIQIRSDIGKRLGVAGAKGDSREETLLGELLDVALCGLSREALRSDVVFRKLPIPFE
jgi:hypothetical protein